LGIFILRWEREGQATSWGMRWGHPALYLGRRARRATSRCRTTSVRESRWGRRHERNGGKPGPGAASHPEGCWSSPFRRRPGSNEASNDGQLQEASVTWGNTPIVAPSLNSFTITCTTGTSGYTIVLFGEHRASGEGEKESTSMEKATALASVDTTNEDRRPIQEREELWSTSPLTSDMDNSSLHAQLGHG
jgi:hypothetical protein